MTTIGEDLTQQRVGDGNGFQQVRRPVQSSGIRSPGSSADPPHILDIGAVNGKTDQQSEGIGDAMTLASLDPLAGIMASDPAALRCFHALAVDHTR